MTTDPDSIPCVYCHGAIATSSFEPWPGGQPLLSAACPTCARRVTLPAAMLERWSARSLSG